MARLFQRLKERKIVQRSLAYLAGAFVVFQAVEVAADPWNITAELQRAIHVLLFFGFLVQLTIAWYHGEKGRQYISGSELLVLAALLVGTGLALSAVWEGDETSGSAEGFTGAAEDPGPSVAVLPFRDLSEGGEQQYFGDGIAEELLHALTRVPGLRVAARASTFRVRDEDIPTVGARLGVGAVLEGSVRMDGNRARVRATLVKVADGFNLWSEEYERELGDLFAVQDDISRRIVTALMGELARDLERPVVEAATTSAEAHDEYLRGRSHWSRRTPEGFFAAIEHFERAISLDSDYALAHAALADTYALVPFLWPGMGVEEALTEAEAAAEKALDLNPRLGEAHNVLGVGRFLGSFDWSGAEREFERAIELSPWDPTSHQRYGLFLTFMGRHAEALAEAQTAAELDPLSLMSVSWLGEAHRQAGLFAEAVVYLEEARDLDPAFPHTWWFLSLAYLQTDRYEESMEAIGRYFALTGGSADAPTPLWEKVVEYARTGVPQPLPPAGQAILEDAHLSMRGLVMAMMGQGDEALAWLHEAVDTGDTTIPLMLSDPALDFIRSDPRFEDLLQKLGLEPRTVPRP